MLPLQRTTSPETLAHMASLVADEADYQAKIIQAREYDAGIQGVRLTERLREIMGGNVTNITTDYDRLRINVTRIVTTAVTERLLVSGFDTNETAIAEPVLDDTGTLKTAPDGTPLQQTVKPVAAQAWDWWQANRMDAKQRRVHEACVRDSEAFVIVDWDNANMRPRFTPHVRFVDQSVTSSTFADVGEGCKAFYRNDDPDQDLLYVTKRWTEVWFDAAGTRRTRQRLTMYLPDQIVKFQGFPGEWQPVRDEGDTAWPIRWVDSAGLPLGIPVAHFISSAGMEAREAWPCQNAINFLAVLEMASADMTAFRILVALGWEPVDADGNPLTIEPGTWVGTTNKDGKVQDIQPADISGISNLIDGWIFRAAMTTDTPVSRFITTKQIAAEGTQKQQEGPLVNKIRGRQGDIGNAWEDVMRIARRLANTFGDAGLDEVPIFYTKWEPAEARDRDAEIARAIQLQTLGIPFRQIAIELGYGAAQVEEWNAEKEARRQEMLQMQAPPPPSQNGNGVPFGKASA